METLINTISIVSAFFSSFQLRVIYVMSLPLWLTYKFSPASYLMLKDMLKLSNLPIWLPNIVLYLSELLIVLCLLFFIALVILLFIIWPIQMVIVFIFRIFNTYATSNNTIREKVTKITSSVFIRLLLATVTLAILSDVFLSVDTPLNVIHEVAHLYITMPYNALLLLFSLGLISPRRY